MAPPIPNADVKEEPAESDLFKEWDRIIPDDVTGYDPPPYAGPPEHPNIDIAALGSSPLKFFSQYFTDGMLLSLVVATNESGLDPPTYPDEIRAVFAVWLYVSVVQLPDFEMYWQHPSHGPFRQPFVADRFTRDRFMAVFRAFSTDATAPSPAHMKANRFACISKFVNALNDLFTDVLKPGDALCVDETMIKFRGEHPSIQLMPKKPIRVGFKCWTISTIGGYVLRSILYEGSKDKADAAVCDYSFSIRSDCCFYLFVMCRV